MCIHAYKCTYKCIWTVWNHRSFVPKVKIHSIFKYTWNVNWKIDRSYLSFVEGLRCVDIVSYRLESLLKREQSRELFFHEGKAFIGFICVHAFLLGLLGRGSWKCQRNGTIMCEGSILEASGKEELSWFGRVNGARLTPALRPSMLSSAWNTLHASLSPCLLLLTLQVSAPLTTQPRQRAPFVVLSPHTLVFAFTVLMAIGNYVFTCFICIFP